MISVSMLIGLILCTVLQTCAEKPVIRSEIRHRSTEASNFDAITDLAV